MCVSLGDCPPKSESKDYLYVCTHVVNDDDDDDFALHIEWLFRVWHAIYSKAEKQNKIVAQITVCVCIDWNCCAAEKMMEMK